jgi:hypothetical protein
MLFYYPENAKTIKDLDRFTYLAYASVSINMNRLNHDSSITFRMLEIASGEFLRTAFDLPYMPTLSMNLMDFVSIDRINRFNITQIEKISILNGYVSSNEYIKGYSLYSNTTYDLLNCNSFTDLTRHSVPCDIFLETSENEIVYGELEITLTPDIVDTLQSPFIVNRSKITINILDYNILPFLTIENPYIEIFGIDVDYNVVNEKIYINTAYDILSTYSYVKINSLLLIGMNSQLGILIFPYIVKKIASLEYQYIDREDFFSVNAVFSLDQAGKKLNVSRLNDSAIFPARLETYEEINLNIPASYTIDNYHFDDPNRLLYVVARDDYGNKYFYVYPIMIPFYTTNIGLLKSTSSQNIKIEYIRDTIDKHYIFSIFPSNKTHGIESLDISIIYSHKRALGLWYASVEYLVGDLVIFAGTEYICIVGHTSTSEFDLDKFNVQQQYIVQGFLLDLISYGIETNKFVIDFDTIFKLDQEAIIQIDTSGNENCTLQILAQYHKLNPIIDRSIASIMSYYNASIISIDNSVVLPVENKSQKLLTDRVNTYHYAPFPNINFTNTDFKVFTTSTDDTIHLNEYKVINIFDTFYLDWENKNIITSDAITHIVNTEVSDYKLLATEYGEDLIEHVISDDYNRTFMN